MLAMLLHRLISAVYFNPAYIYYSDRAYIRYQTGMTSILVLRCCWPRLKWENYVCSCCPTQTSSQIPLVIVAWLVFAAVIGLMWENYMCCFCPTQIPSNDFQKRGSRSEGVTTRTMGMASVMYAPNRSNSTHTQHTNFKASMTLIIPSTFYVLCRKTLRDSQYFGCCVYYHTMCSRGWRGPKYSSSKLIQGDGQNISHRPPKSTKFSQHYARTLTTLVLSTATMMPWGKITRYRLLGSTTYHKCDLVATSSAILSC